MNFIGNATFKQNSAGSGDAGGIYLQKSTANFSGDTTFRSNVAQRIGGGIILSDSTLNFVGNTAFRKNSAKFTGGGISSLYTAL